MTDTNIHSSEKTSSFGFKDLPEAEKVAKVHGVFANVAPRYDVMNDLMSAGVHHLWKDAACAKLNPQPGEVIIDCAGGTGDIARRLAKLARAAKNRRLARGVEAKDAQITIIDYNEAMIMAGREKSRLKHYDEPEITWSVGDAMNLAIADQSIDAYIISFGIRNVADVQGALNEAKRVLKPGGRFFCLEFSKPASSVIAKAYETYSFKVIPWLGERVAKDRDSYQYLVESIKRFPDQESLKAMMLKAGFTHVAYDNFTNGVAALHYGRA
jgi:demethylmenaquinone methyltransferase/2-methoxy-6-polyprenyl-1,4-benzoquinol methylase